MCALWERNTCVRVEIRGKSGTSGVSLGQGLFIFLLGAGNQLWSYEQPPSPASKSTTEERWKGVRHLFSRKDSIRSNMSWRGNKPSLKEAALFGAEGPCDSHNMWAVWSELSFELPSLSGFSLPWARDGGARPGISVTGCSCTPESETPSGQLPGEVPRSVLPGARNWATRLVSVHLEREPAQASWGMPCSLPMGHSGPCCPSAKSGLSPHPGLLSLSHPPHPAGPQSCQLSLLHVWQILPLGSPALPLACPCYFLPAGLWWPPNWSSSAHTAPPPVHFPCPVWSL